MHYLYSDVPVLYFTVLNRERETAAEICQVSSAVTRGGPAKSGAQARQCGPEECGSERCVVDLSCGWGSPGGQVREHACIV